jgi:hypothetical protein
MALQFKRGLDANRTSVTPEEGEIIITYEAGLSSPKLYVGNGTTPGGLLITAGGGGSSFDQQLNTTDEVDFESVTAENFYGSVSSATSVESENYFLKLFDPQTEYNGTDAIQITAQNITTSLGFGVINHWMKFSGSVGVFDSKKIVLAPDEANGWTLALGGITSNYEIIPPAPTYITESWITDMYGVNLEVTGDTDLGSVSNITIDGGSAGQVLTTDGSGNLSWSTISSAGIIALDGLSDVELNSPLTAGQVLKYDGTKWVNDDDVSGEIYTLPTASNTVLGGVKVDGSTITIDGNGIISGSSTYSLPTASTTVLGGVKVDGSTVTINGDGVISAASTGGALASRNNSNATTTSLNDGQRGNLTITGFKGYALYKIATTHAAWVRVYTSTSARDNDSSRLEGEDPLPGAGVIAEIVTTGSGTVLITPGAFGFSDENPPDANIYLYVTNKSGAPAAITITLTLLQLEA